MVAVILTAVACASAQAQPAASLAHTEAAPHIALVLPLSSPPFAQSADMVRQGFLMADSVQALPLPVRVYPTTDADSAVLAAYEQAVESGARFVVGPLTRANVTAIAAQPALPVPTLVLNLPDVRTLPARLEVFALNSEAEARQVARFAFKDGRRRVLTISDELPLNRRVQRAFAEEMTRLGGSVSADFRFAANAQRLNLIHQEATPQLADAVFLALDGSAARTVRPVLDPTLAVYATSQVNTGSALMQSRRELERGAFHRHAVDAFAAACRSHGVSASAS